MDKIKSITRGQAILFGLVILIGLGIFIGIKMFNNNSLEQYHEFEKDLKVYAKQYIKINGVVIQKDGEKRFTIKQLDKQNLVINDMKNKCTGYVYVLNQLDIETEKYKKIYYSYIKCGSQYKTPGYEVY